jgi:hypothetical protein
MAETGFVKKYGKRSFIYALILLILISLTGLLQWVDTGAADTYYYFAQALVLVLGVTHVFLMYRFIPQIHPGDFWKGLGITFLIMLAGAIATAILYHFIGLDYRFLTYILPFIVPWLCWQVFRVFFQIPSPAFKTWYYPLHEEMPDLDMIDLSQIEVVQFVFSKNPQDATQTNFTAKAPLNMTLGQLFFIFINDYNDKNEQHPIHYLKSADQPHGWFFYRKKKWFNQKEFLDSDLSFLNNAIQPNEFIYAVRES